MLLDMAKGALPVLLLPPRFAPSQPVLWAIAFGVAAIIGHVKSVFLLWKGGGKGVATAGGVFLALAPVPSLIADLRIRARPVSLRLCIPGLSHERSDSHRRGRDYVWCDLADRDCVRAHHTVRVLDAPREYRTAAARGREPLSTREARDLMRCAVVGAGAWGTALADLLARNDHRVALWAREPEVVASVNAQHENTTFLAGARLHDRVVAHPDLESACSGAELVLFATPSHVLQRHRARGGPVDRRRHGDRRRNQGHRARDARGDERCARGAVPPARHRGALGTELRGGGRGAAADCGRRCLEQ